MPNTQPGRGCPCRSVRPIRACIHSPQFFVIYYILNHRVPWCGLQFSELMR